jgi:hypothetical protein
LLHLDDGSDPTSAVTAIICCRDSTRSASFKAAIGEYAEQLVGRIDRTRNADVAA